MSPLSWPMWSVMLNIFSLELLSKHQSLRFYPQGSSPREEAFFFGFWKFSYAGQKEKARMIYIYRYPQSVFSGLLQVPLGALSQGEERSGWKGRPMGNP